jgi:hypothetical protein
MRIEAAIVLVLATGGWVCDGENSCPGTNTCAVDVANVCCPFGEPYWCNGSCWPTTALCPIDDAVYACDDEAPHPSCTFSATIDAVTCTPTDNSGHNWRVQTSGTASGCGDEGIYIARSDGTAYGGLDCGDWTLGMFRSSCLPHDNTTTWSVDDYFSSLAASAAVSVDVKTGEGAVLATLSARCN